MRKREAQNARTLTWFDNTVDKTLCTCLEGSMVSQEDTARWANQGIIATRSRLLLHFSRR